MNNRIDYYQPRYLTGVNLTMGNSRINAVAKDQPANLTGGIAAGVKNVQPGFSLKEGSRINGGAGTSIENNSKSEQIMKKFGLQDCET